MFSTAASSANLRPKPNQSHATSIPDHQPSKTWPAPAAAPPTAKRTSHLQRATAEQSSHREFRSQRVPHNTGSNGWHNPTLTAQLNNNSKNSNVSIHAQHEVQHHSNNAAPKSLQISQHTPFQSKAQQHSSAVPIADSYLRCDEINSLILNSPSSDAPAPMQQLTQIVHQYAGLMNRVNVATAIHVAVKIACPSTTSSSRQAPVGSNSRYARASQLEAAPRPEVAGTLGTVRQSKAAMQVGVAKQVKAARQLLDSHLLPLFHHKLAAMQLRDVASCVWALARLGHHPGHGFMHDVVCHALQQDGYLIRRGNPQDWSMLTWGLARFHSSQGTALDTSTQTALVLADSQTEADAVDAMDLDNVQLMGTTGAAVRMLTQELFGIVAEIVIQHLTAPNSRTMHHEQIDAGRQPAGLPRYPAPFPLAGTNPSSHPSIHTNMHPISNQLHAGTATPGPVIGRNSPGCTTQAMAETTEYTEPASGRNSPSRAPHAAAEPSSSVGLLSRPASEPGGSSSNWLLDSERMRLELSALLSPTVPDTCPSPATMSQSLSKRDPLTPATMLPSNEAGTLTHPSNSGFLQRQSSFSQLQPSLPQHSGNDATSNRQSAIGTAPARRRPSSGHGSSADAAALAAAAGFMPLTLSSLAYSFAAMPHPAAQQVVQAVCGVVQRDVAQFSPSELADVMWSAACLQVSDTAFFKACLPQAARLAPKMQPQELGTALWACSRLNLLHPPFVQAAATAAVGLLPIANPSLLVKITGALAKLQCEQLGAMGVLLDAVQEGVSELESHELCHVMQACALLKLSHPAATLASTQLLHSPHPPSLHLLVDAARAAARLNHNATSRLLQAATQAATRDPCQLNPQVAVHLLWVAATRGGVPEPNGFFPAVRAALRRCVPSMQPLQLAVVLAACAKMDHYDAALVGDLCDSLGVWVGSGSMVGESAVRLQGRIVGKSAAPVQGLMNGELAVPGQGRVDVESAALALWALGHLRHYDSPLVEALMEVCLKEAGCMGAGQSTWANAGKVLDEHSLMGGFQLDAGQDTTANQPLGMMVQEEEREEGLNGLLCNAPAGVGIVGTSKHVSWIDGGVANNAVHWTTSGNPAVVSLKDADSAHHASTVHSGMSSGATLDAPLKTHHTTDTLAAHSATSLHGSSNAAGLTTDWLNSALFWSGLRLVRSSRADPTRFGLLRVLGAKMCLDTDNGVVPPTGVEAVNGAILSAEHKMVNTAGGVVNGAGRGVAHGAAEGATTVDLSGIPGSVQEAVNQMASGIAGAVQGAAPEAVQSRLSKWVNRSAADGVRMGMSGRTSPVHDDHVDTGAHAMHAAGPAVNYSHRRVVDGAVLEALPTDSSNHTLVDGGNSGHASRTGASNETATGALTELDGLVSGVFDSVSPVVNTMQHMLVDVPRNEASSSKGHDPSEQLSSGSGASSSSDTPHAKGSATCKNHHASLHANADGTMSNSSRPHVLTSPNISITINPAGCTFGSNNSQITNMPTTTATTDNAISTTPPGTTTTTASSMTNSFNARGPVISSKSVNTTLSSSSRSAITTNSSGKVSGGVEDERLWLEPRQLCRLLRTCSVFGLRPPWLLSLAQHSLEQWPAAFSTWTLCRLAGTLPLLEVTEVQVYTRILDLLSPLCGGNMATSLPPAALAQLLRAHITLQDLTGEDLLSQRRHPGLLAACTRAALSSRWASSCRQAAFVPEEVRQVTQALERVSHGRRVHASTASGIAATAGHGSGATGQQAAKLGSIGARTSSIAVKQSTRHSAASCAVASGTGVAMADVNKRGLLGIGSHVHEGDRTVQPAAPCSLSAVDVRGGLFSVDAVVQVGGHAVGVVVHLPRHYTRTQPQQLVGFERWRLRRLQDEFAARVVALPWFEVVGLSEGELQEWLQGQLEAAVS